MADSPRPALLAAAVLTAWAVLMAVAPGRMPDFFIYRLGAELAARGEPTYDLARVRARVAEAFPDPDPKPESFVNNCGYFLPPGAAVLYLPFALLPLGAAKVAWALVSGLAGFAVARVPQLLRWPADPHPPGLVPLLLPFLLLLNFLTIGVVMVGQTTLVCTGCVIAGLWCFERPGRGWFWLGVCLWAVPFVKPHAALPLVPLAWYLGGWTRAAALVAVVAALNLVGATLAGGSPLFLRDYLAFLADSHGAVMFNRAGLNPEITSWNRLLFVAGGPLIEQRAAAMLASHLVWFGLICGRCALAGTKPSPTWALAAAAAGAVVCPQVLAYEAFVLVLAVPWVRDLFADGRRGWGLAAAGALLLQAVPYQAFEAVGFGFHRPLGAALFALLVLVGPVRPRPSATG